MAKPASKPNWTYTNPDFPTVTIEPTVQKKINGWLADERPPHEFFNWLFFNISEWIDYLDIQTEAISSQLGLFDAVVGAGGTHADINAVMADPQTIAGVIKNVFVISSIAVAVTQVIDQPGMSFTFHPRATVLKDGATIGITIDAPKVRIKAGRFLNFSAVGNKAINMTANAVNCFITENIFMNCATMIDDALANNNVISNNIEEV